MTMQNQQIAFIGTGIMGSRMVRNLLRGGYAVRVYNRTPEKAEALVKDGAVFCASIAECVQGCQRIITIVGMPADVQECYQKIFQSAQPGSIACDMTTSSPALARTLYEEGRSHGIAMLDAPVSGGDSGAEKGTLAIMCGGDQTAFDTFLPIFRCMGSRVLYMGPAGSGQNTKMANQIAIAGCVTGVAEALMYAQKAGLDQAAVLDAISSGAAGSWQMSNNGPKMIAADDAPGFQIRHFIKDMKLAEEEAKANGISLPVLELVLQEYQELADAGRQNCGTQSIWRIYHR